MITCCYCGVHSRFIRNSTVLTLVCGTCGAPLAAQKPRPLADHKGAKLPSNAPNAHAQHAPAAKAIREGFSAMATATGRPKKTKKKKKKKSTWGKALGEVFDVIEDIFD